MPHFPPCRIEEDFAAKVSISFLLRPFPKDCPFQRPLRCSPPAARCRKGEGYLSSPVPEGARPFAIKKTFSNARSELLKAPPSDAVTSPIHVSGQETGVMHLEPPFFPLVDPVTSETHFPPLPCKNPPQSFLPGPPHFVTLRIAKSFFCKAKHLGDPPFSEGGPASSSPQRQCPSPLFLGRKFLFAPDCFQHHSPPPRFTVLSPSGKSILFLRRREDEKVSFFFLSR